MPTPAQKSRTPGSSARKASSKSKKTPRTGKTPKSSTKKRSARKKAHATPASALTAYETFKLLPAVTQPYTDSDVALVQDIIFTAQQRWDEQRPGRSQEPMSLMHVLRAYETILRESGLSPDDDTYYYRFLLKLSLDYSTDDWMEKFEKERFNNERARVARQYSRSSKLKTVWDSWASHGVQSNEPTRGPPALGLNQSAYSPHSRRSSSPVDLYLSGERFGSQAGSPAAHSIASASAYADPRRSNSTEHGPLPGSPAYVIREMSNWADSQRNVYGSSPRSPAAGSPLQQQPMSPLSGRSPGRSYADFDEVGMSSQLNSSRGGGGDRSFAMATMAANDTSAYQDFKMTAEAFRAWQNFALRGRQRQTEQNRALEMYIDALNHWAAYQMSRILRGWSEFAGRRGRAAIIRHRQRCVVRWAWECFLSGCHEMLKRTAAVERAKLHWAKKNWKVHFRHWKHVTKYERSTRPPLVHPMMILAGLLLRRSRKLPMVAIPDMYSLNYAPELRKPTRQKVLQQAQSVLKRWFLQLIWYAWVNHMDEVLHMMQLAGRRWKVSGCRVYIQIWVQRMRLYVEHRDRMAVKIREKRALILVRIVLHQFRTHRVLSRSKKERATWLRAELSRSHKKFVFEAWLHVTALRIFDKGKILAHLHHKLMRLVSSALTGWSLWAKRAIKVAAWVKRHYESINRATTIYFFHRWADKAQYSAHLQQSYVKIVRLLDSNSKREGWRTWSHELRVRWSCRNHFVWLLRFALRILFKFSVKAQHLRRLEREVVLVSLQKSKQWRLRRWLLYADREKLIRGEAEAIVYRRRDRKLTAILMAMRKHATRKILNRLHVERSRIIMAQVTKRNIFADWAAAVEKMQANTREKIRATQHWATQMLMSFLNRWREYHPISVEYSDKADLALQLWSVHTKMHCMTSWIFFVHGRRLAEQWTHKMNVFIVRGNQKYLRGCLHQWHNRWQFKTVKRARIAHVIAHWRRVNLFKAFHAWVLRAADLQGRKELLAEALATWQPGFDGRVWASQYEVKDHIKQMANSHRNARIIDYTFASFTRNWERKIFKRESQEHVVWHYKEHLYRLMFYPWRRMTLAAHHHAQRMVTIPFEAWARHYRKRKHCVEVHDMLHEARRMESQQRSLQWWHRRWIQHVGLATMLGNCRTGGLTTHFHAMKTFASSKIVRRQSIAMAEAHRVQAMQQVAVGKMVALVEARHKLRTKLGRADRFAQARAMHRLWAEFDEGCKRSGYEKRMEAAAFAHHGRTQMIMTMLPWRQWVDDKMLAREHKATALAFYMSRLLLRWVHYTSMLQHQTRIMTGALLHWSTNHCLRFLLELHTLVKERLRHRMVHDHLYTNHIRLVIRQHLLGWQEGARAVQMDRERTQDIQDLCVFNHTRQKWNWWKARAHERLGKKLNAFDAWRQCFYQKVGRRTLREIVAVRQKQSLLYRWYVRTEVQQGLRALALRVKTRVERMFFHAFSQAIWDRQYRQQQLVPLMLRFAGHWYLGLQRWIFDGWHNHAWMVVLCRKFQMINGEQLVQKFFGSWRETTLASLHMQSVARRVMARLTNMSKDKNFIAWISYVDHCVKIRIFCSSLQDKGLKSSFDQWTAYIARVVQGFTVGDMVARHHRTNMLRVGMHAWKIFRTICIIMGRTQEATAKQLFTRWLAWIDKKRATEQKLVMLEKLRDSYQKTAPIDWTQVCYFRWKYLDYFIPFLHWQEVVQAILTMKAACKIGLQSHSLNYTRQCWVVWKNLVQLHRKALIAGQFFKAKGLAFAFGAWFELVQFKIELRHKSRSVLLVLAASTVEAVFYAWKRIVYTTRCVMFQLHHKAHRICVRAIGEWKICAAEFGIKRTQILSARCHWAVSILLRVLSDWFDWLHSRKLSQRVLELRRAKINRLRAEQTLRAWHFTALRRSRLRMQAIEMWRCNHLSRFLGAWLLVATHSVELKHNTVVAVRHRVRSNMRSWLRTAQRLARNRYVSDAYWARLGLKWHFHAFHKTVRRLRFVREILVLWDPKSKFHRLRIAFSNYTCAILIKFHRVERMEQALAHHDQSKGRRAIWHWKHFLCLRSHVKKWRAGGVYRAFGKWQSLYIEALSVERKEIRAVHHQLAHSQRTAFTAMRRFVHACKVMRGKIEHADAHSAMYLRLSAGRHFIDRMRFVIHVERYAAAALHRNNMALLKEIWLPLVEFQQYKNMMRANTVIANRFATSKRFMRWRVGIILDLLKFETDSKDPQLCTDVHKSLLNGDAEGARLLAVRRNVISAWINASIVRSFDRWKKMAHGQILYRDAMIYLLGIESTLLKRKWLRESRYVKKAYFTWAGNVRLQVHLRKLFASKSSQMFEIWAQNVKDKTSNQKVEKFLEMCLGQSLKRRVLAAWHKAVRYSEKHDASMLTLFHNLRAKLSRRMTFNTWRMCVSLRDMVNTHRSLVLYCVELSQVRSRGARRRLDNLTYWRRRQKEYVTVAHGGERQDNLHIFLVNRFEDLNTSGKQLSSRQREDMAEANEEVMAAIRRTDAFILVDQWVGQRQTDPRDANCFIEPHGNNRSLCRTWFSRWQRKVQTQLQIRSIRDEQGSMSLSHWYMFVLVRLEVLSLATGTVFVPIQSGGQSAEEKKRMRKTNAGRTFQQIQQTRLRDKVPLMERYMQGLGRLAFKTWYLAVLSSRIRARVAPFVSKIRTLPMLRAARVCVEAILKPEWMGQQASDMELSEAQKRELDEWSTAVEAQGQARRVYQQVVFQGFVKTTMEARNARLERTLVAEQRFRQRQRAVYRRCLKHWHRLYAVAQLGQSLHVRRRMWWRKFMFTFWKGIVTNRHVKIVAAEQAYDYWSRRALSRAFVRLHLFVLSNTKLEATDIDTHFSAAEETGVPVEIVAVEDVPELHEQVVGRVAESMQHSLPPPRGAAVRDSAF